MVKNLNHHKILELLIVVISVRKRYKLQCIDFYVSTLKTFSQTEHSSLLTNLAEKHLLTILTAFVIAVTIS